MKGLIHRNDFSVAQGLEAASLSTRKIGLACGLFCEGSSKGRASPDPLYTLWGAIFGHHTMVWKMSNPPVTSLVCHKPRMEFTAPDMTASKLCLTLRARGDTKTREEGGGF